MVAEHPGTRVLKKSEEIKSAPYETYFNNPEKTGIFHTTWLQDRLPGKTLIHGLKLGVHALAVTDAVLAKGAVVKGKLGEVGVKMTRGADGGITARRTDTDTTLIVRTAYWFAWSTYFPNTGVID